VWLRIHKTAGTSIYDGFLWRHCINISKRAPNVNDPKKAQKWIDNTTDEELKEYFIWTVVRNPYDRFASMAGMFSSDPNKFARGFDVYSQKGIVERHTRPQYLFTHSNGQCIPNWILDFECLQKDFNLLCERLELPNHTLEKRNTSRHGEWKDEFDRETLDFVNEYYKKDFEYFNYEMI